MYLLIIFLPFFSFILITFFGRFFGNLGGSVLIIFNMFCCFLVSIILFLEVGLTGGLCFIKLGFWFMFNYLFVSWGFLFDPLTIILLFLVSFVSFFVHFYSFFYMLYDPYLARFLSLLSFFTFSMFLLVSADNFLQLFLGWESVGISSYLLINFWYTRLEANKSALKAVFINRIGDFFFMLFLFVVFILFSSFDFSVIFTLLTFIDYNLLFFLCVFLILAAIAKSAQIGLHIWLPDAMEGPTPVSALIHAATMVTAGVFLMLRSFILLQYTYQFIFFLLIFFGALTAIIASSIALFQNDLKKIIAYSTCSQLGYMFFSLGLGLASLSLFHLFNHGFFKALLFLGAGCIIHSFNDEQDIRKMGGTVFLLPFVFILFVFSSLSLMGFPFLTGFFSKDLIIVSFFFSDLIFDISFFFFCCLLAASLTAFYSLRLIFFVFFKNFEGFKPNLVNFKEDYSFFLMIPLFSLFLGTVFFGFLFRDFFLGYGSNIWQYVFLRINLFENLFSFLDFEFLEFLFVLKFLPFFISFLGSYLFFCFYYLFFFMFRYNLIIYFNFILVTLFFFYKKYFFDYFFSKMTVMFLNFSKAVFLLLDRGVLEILTTSSVVRYFLSSYFLLFFLQTGFLYHYLMFFGVNFFLFFIFCFFVKFFYFFLFFFVLLFYFIKVNV